MPKPVKKAAPTKKPAAKVRPSSDPNRRARQLMDEHAGKMGQGKWAEPDPPGDLPITTTNTSSDATRDELEIFDAMFRTKMAELGRKGGKVSGAKRMEMPEKTRKEVAKKAAAARWGRKGQ